MNRVISVDEGKENRIGTTTGAPLVETEIEGTVMVGRTKSELADGLITSMVAGRMLRK